jgi:hypothetical protein
LKPVLTVKLASEPLERIRADVLVVGVAPTDRPLRGAAGYADWRLCGHLWELVSSGRILGTRGQASLVIAGDGLQTRLLLVLGLGPRRSLDGPVWQELGRDAIDRSLGLCAQTVALAIVEDALIGPPTDPQRQAEAVSGLVCGAAHAVLAREATLEVSFLGPTLAVPPDTTVPAGVEVQLPGSGHSTELPQIETGSPALVSRAVQGNSPTRRFQ